MTDAEIQSEILRVICQRRANLHLGGICGPSFIAGQGKRADPQRQLQNMEAVWSLISQGLAYLDFTQPSASNWILLPTAKGRAAISDEDINPDSPAGYMQSLSREVPSLSETVTSYVREAQSAYRAGLYRASAVMLGVASEAAVLEVATVLGKTLQGNEARKYLQTIDARKTNYLPKFDAFRKKLESKKACLPPELTDGLDLTMNSVADLLRLYRNDSGHPTGRTLNQQDCFISLQIFVRYAKRLYDIKAYLQASADAAGRSEA